jgi:PIN domain nuclease of toxin-antitoxin system
MRQTLDIKHCTYWLLNRNSKLSTDNKLLIYNAEIKAIWTSGILLWGTAVNLRRSNLATQAAARAAEHARDTGRRPATPRLATGHAPPPPRPAKPSRRSGYTDPRVRVYLAGAQYTDIESIVVKDLFINKGHKRPIFVT